MNNSTQRLFAGLLLATLFAACSRPVAYFQKSPREQLATTTPIMPTSAAEVVTPANDMVAAPVIIAPEVQVAQANAALNQLEAVVRNDSKLSADKTVEKRLNRMHTLLTSAAAKASPASSNVTASKKMNLMERMMLKQMNRKISKHLAPANPNKPMVNTAILSAGAVVAIVGLIILLVGGSATAGTVILLAGAVILLVGLL